MPLPTKDIEGIKKFRKYRKAGLTYRDIEKLTGKGLKTLARWNSYIKSGVVKFDGNIINSKKLVRISVPRKVSPLPKSMSGRDRTRELVRIRDKHTCADCGKKWKQGERKFDIHHLNGLCGKKSKSYDKQKDMNELITLCHKCHFNRSEHTLKRIK